MKTTSESDVVISNHTSNFTNELPLNETTSTTTTTKTPPTTTTTAGIKDHLNYLSNCWESQIIPCLSYCPAGIIVINMQSTGNYNSKATSKELSVLGMLEAIIFTIR